MKLKKGILHEFSKIQEEFDELLDAHEQGGKILAICEIADLYGAIEVYVQSKYNLSMDDIKQMSEMTSSDFEEGKRR